MAERPTGCFAIRDDVRPFVGTSVAWDEPEHRGPWLVALGENADRFAILAVPKSLLGAFERAAQDPTDAAILRLASRFGWLRQPVDLVAMANRGKRGLLAGKDILVGEQIGDWRDALLHLQDLFSVWRAIRALEAMDVTPSARGTARTLLRQRIRRTPRGTLVYINDQMAARHPFLRRTTLFAAGQPDADGIEAYLRPDAELRGARLYLALELNRTVREGWAYPVLMPLRQNVIRVFPRAALAAVHLALMIEVAGGIPERACSRCGELFDATPRHKQFCSRACKEAARKARASAARGMSLSSLDGA